ncbi:uncharacterized protein LOC120933204 isoform X2 [Rana temporaria]|uniref:uncharacterized protein LOC120933204 isoform X2 n=1 Tax=Rana temporaria TaxID=8407 RepID=UPI001AADA5A1|nr:uncharacterized protein LOC120933204 isoform X2 [Rana temporaria]
MPHGSTNWRGRPAHPLPGSQDRELGRSCQCHTLRVPSSSQAAGEETRRCHVPARLCHLVVTGSVQSTTGRRRIAPPPAASSATTTTTTTTTTSTTVVVIIVSSLIRV